MPTVREIALGVARQHIPCGVMADVIDDLRREQPGPMSRPGEASSRAGRAGPFDHPGSATPGPLFGK
jgi:hypothetical protein